jgi:hypothetical protein
MLYVMVFINSSDFKDILDYVLDKSYIYLIVMSY